ncbi:MAG TPA: DegT/DnrJ/EryC1/StrS family aminotransferase [Candidatus Wujingus californicus]|uniref:DegT/DnrJ/EryC1/StrS family aminotransferase n=1 Tax=Candidatus Wujingus californicus TaxID=3367618 RepID=UPI004029C887
MSIIKIPWAKPDIGQEELNEIIDSFQSNWLTMGPKVERLEREMAAFLDVPYAIAVFNGTIALDLALKVIGVSAGDEVIVPALTYYSTASMVSYQNAVPVFVDIERQSFNLDPEMISYAVSEKTRAIIFIDYGGNPSDFDNIAMIGKRYGIPVLQDGAQSLGAVYKGKPMGAQTEISTVSFHMAKVMTTIEGGMIFTYNESFKENILAMRNQGEFKGRKYEHKVLGINARMTDLQAAIGLAQYRKLPKLLEQRNRVAAKYDQIFNQRRSKVSIVTTQRENSQNAYFFYPILIEDRDRVAYLLREKYGIDTRIAYPMPVYKQEVYTIGKLRCRIMECPVAEEITSKILNLPIFPSMTDDMIEQVCNAVFDEVE